MTSTEIAIRDTGNGVIAERDIVDGWLQVASDVIKLAGVVAPTDFVPEAYRDNPPAVAAAILTGRELGIGPLTSLRHIQIVKGVPTLSAEYKRARVLAAGHEFDILELNTQRCRVSGRRKGSNKPPLEITYTMEDAKVAGLLVPSRSGKPGAWQTRPRRMLFARAGSELCDFLFADVVNGLPTAELVGDSDGDDVLEASTDAGASAPGSSGTADSVDKAATAQRKTRTRTAPPAQPPSPPAATPDGPVQDAGGALPPLPGEEDPTGAPDAAASASTGAPASGQTAQPDDTDYDTPATATSGKGGQLTAIWTVLNTVFNFGNDEKEQARAVVEHIVGHKLIGGTTATLSYNEAKTVLDTLAHWQHQAAEKGEHPRDYLIAVMVAQDTAGESGE